MLRIKQESRDRMDDSISKLVIDEEISENCLGDETDYPAMVMFK